jgi:phosphatidylserine decarboxylase
MDFREHRPVAHALGCTKLVVAAFPLGVSLVAPALAPASVPTLDSSLGSGQPGGTLIVTRTVQVRDRKTGDFQTEPVSGASLVALARIPLLGGVFRWLLFDLGIVSRFLGWLADRSFSRRFIPRFIRSQGIDTSELSDPVDSYPSLNAFFTRRLNRDFTVATENGTTRLRSPADGCVLAFCGLHSDDPIRVKHSVIDIGSLIGPGALDFLAGDETDKKNPKFDVFIIRLAPKDYHRFHFPCAGRLLDFYDIPGGLLPVHPAALAVFQRVHTVNHRHVSCLDGELGRFVQVEVGAFGVGAIRQTHVAEEFNALDEKGLFRIGGSTVVLVLPAGVVEADADLLRSSHDGIETRLRVGDGL